VGSKLTVGISTNFQQKKSRWHQQDLISAKHLRASGLVQRFDKRLTGATAKVNPSSSICYVSSVRIGAPHFLQLKFVPKGSFQSLKTTLHFSQNIPRSCASPHQIIRHENGTIKYKGQSC
jgi:hypothetical protein